jgi:hypothetical protein
MKDEITWDFFNGGVRQGSLVMTLVDVEGNQFELTIGKFFVDESRQLTCTFKSTYPEEEEFFLERSDFLVRTPNYFMNLRLNEVKIDSDGVEPLMKFTEKEK